jgi:hypothetical protein
MIKLSSLAMSESRRTVVKRTAGFSSFRLTAVQIDQLHGATHAKSSQLNGAAVTRNLEMLFEQMYRRYRGGLPSDHPLVERSAPAPRAASSAQVCS